MFGNKIKLRDGLLERVQVFSDKLGCTPTEFIEKCVEHELERLEKQPSNNSKELSNSEVDDIVGKLKGLGYLE